MNCRALRRRVLASDRPEVVGTDAARHLAACDACHRWRECLLTAERDLPLLPVPSADGARDRFQEGFRAAGSADPCVIRLAAPALLPPRERGLRKLAVAIALVAALLVFAIGVTFWPHPRTSVAAVDAQLAERQARRDRRLAAAGSARERVVILADLADELRAEALTLSTAERRRTMPVIVRFYREVVRDNLPAHARQLSVQDRDVVTAVAERLARAESELARQAAERHVAADDPLHELAIAAREGHDHLRRLLL